MTAFYRTYGAEYADDWTRRFPAFDYPDPPNPVSKTRQEDSKNPAVFWDCVVHSGLSDDSYSPGDWMPWTGSRNTKVSPPCFVTHPDLSNMIDWYDPKTKVSQSNAQREETRSSSTSHPARNTIPAARQSQVPMGLRLGENESKSDETEDETIYPTPYKAEDPKERLELATDITIGVELEAIITDIPTSELSELMQRVAVTLEPLATRLGTVARARDLLQGYGNPAWPNYNNFTVYEDYSIRTDDEKARLFTLGDLGGISMNMVTAEGVEIATPILRNNQWTWVIPEMLQAIGNRFSVLFNSSTGLHVHIGIGRKYILQDLRRIAKAVVLFEAHLNKYHPVCRNPLGVDSHQHILSCRGNILLKGLSNPKMLRELNKARNINELLCIINGLPHFNHFYNNSRYYKGYRYNLTSVNKLGTVEFRQAIGTLDGRKTVNWIERVVKFITSAITTTDEVFEGWGRRGIQDWAVYRLFGVPPPLYCRSGRARIRIHLPRRRVFFLKQSISAKRKLVSAARYTKISDGFGMHILRDKRRSYQFSTKGIALGS